MQEFGERTVPMSDIHQENLEGGGEASSCSASEAKRSIAALGSAVYPESVKLRRAWIFTVGHFGDSAKLETFKILPERTT